MIRSLALMVTLLALAAPVGRGSDETIAPPVRYVAATEGWIVSGEGFPDNLELLERIWFWTAQTPARSIAASQLSDPAALDRLFEPQSTSMTWSVPVPRGGRKSRLEVIAAPQQMWEEIPEGELPRYACDGDWICRVPVDSTEGLRLRMIADGMATWWIDLPPRGRMAPQVLQPAVDVDLRILGADGKGVPSAAVDLVSDTPGRIQNQGLVHFRTDAAGRLKIAAVPATEKIALRITAHQHAATVVRGRISDLPGEVRLEKGARIVGRFVDEESHPIKGVTVVTETFISDHPPLLQSDEVTTDETGGWSVEGLPRDRKILVRATRSGYSPFLIESVGQGDHDFGTVVLEPAAELLMAVHDDRRRPVKNAAVGWRGDTFTTDAKGLVTVEDVPLEGELELTVIADRHVPLRTRVALPQAKRHDLQLIRSYRIRGFFVDSNGVPVADGVARIVIGNSDRLHRIGGDGSFAIDVPPDEEIDLSFAGANSGEVRLRVEPGQPGQERDLGTIQAAAGVIVAGRLTSESAGEPIGGATVWTPRPAKNPVLAWVRGDLIKTTTAADGSFELSGLPFFPVLLRMDAPAHARAERELQPSPEVFRYELGEIVMSGGTTVEVRLDDDEQSSAEARLDLRGESYDFDVVSSPFVKGVATIPHVPAGPAQLSVVSGRMVLCEQEVNVTGEDHQRVDCASQRVRVSGTVYAGSRPAGGGVLNWSSAKSAERPTTIINMESPHGLRTQRTYGGGGGHVSVPVDGNGRFTSTELRPGRWVVAWTAPAGGVSSSRDVVIPESEAFETELRFSSGSLRGVVVDEDGATVRHAAVSLSNGAAMLSRADGSFMFNDVPAGRYTIRAELRDLSSGKQPIELIEGRESPAIRLVLTNETPDEIAVSARGSAGEPAAGAIVFLESEQGSRMTTADAQGMARVSFSGGKPRRFRAAAHYQGRWAFGGWAETQPVEIRVGETGSLRITSGTGGRVELTPETGWNLGVMLARVGVPLMALAGRPLTIHGLPEGEYRVVIEGSEKRIGVRRGRESALELD